MIRKQIFILYRTKLRLCRHMGYQFGSWSPPYRPIPRHLHLKDIERYINKNIIGNFVWNNVRIQYKTMMYEEDPFIINDAIDEAFASLRYINYIMSVYKNKHKKLLTS